MKSNRIFGAIGAVVILALVVWVARATEWAEVKVPLPLRGEALRNPFYGAQRFVEALGARAIRDDSLGPPPPDAALVLTDWRFNLSTRRRDALTRWVESGGRLIVDSTIAGDVAFGQWVGFERKVRELDPDDELSADIPENIVIRPCNPVREERTGRVADGAARTSYNWCGGNLLTFLAPTRPPAWALREESGLQAVRIAVGQGSVTVLNAPLYQYREILAGDHAAIFAAAVQLRRGDQVHFLTEADHPSLLALIWREGASVVMLSLGALALALWRGAGRFGPLAAPHSHARRSLAEQILGTGRFAVRGGDEHALYDAVARGLTEAVRRRVPGFDRLTESDRATAIAALTNMDASALNAALHDPARRRSERLRSTVALLEHARRRALQAPVRSSHGTR